MLSILIPVVTAAHHSVAAWFEWEGRQEIAGEITEIRWQNPHILFWVRVDDGRMFEIETFSPNGVERWGVTKDLLNVGEQVRLTGMPSKRGLDNIFATNILLESGRELLFVGEAVYSDDTLRGFERLRVNEGIAAEAERGVFKVWSQPRNARMLFPEGFDLDFDITTYPLNDAALAAYQQFNYLEQDPTIDCQPKGMPPIMEQPYPIEFVDAGDRILLYIEEYDQIRTIYMDDIPDAAEQPPSLHGFSTGRFERRNLIVTTTKINSGTFDTVGVPLSLEARLEERFEPSADGASMNYHLTIHDPIYLTAPVETSKRFIYRPEIALGRYDCQPQ